MDSIDQQSIDQYVWYDPIVEIWFHILQIDIGILINTIHSDCLFDPYIRNYQSDHLILPFYDNSYFYIGMLMYKVNHSLKQHIYQSTDSVLYHKHNYNNLGSHHNLHLLMIYTNTTLLIHSHLDSHYYWITLYYLYYTLSSTCPSIILSISFYFLIQSSHVSLFSSINSIYSSLNTIYWIQNSVYISNS